MAEMSIPGVTGEGKYDKLIDRLMEVERVPLKKLEHTSQSARDKKRVWQTLRRKLSALQRSAKDLIGFTNPFDDRLALSSDPSFLTATAKRSSDQEEMQLKIVQTAKADRFLSRAQKGDFRVPEGNYRFSIGDKEILLKYRGGSLKDFSKKLNLKAPDLLRTSVVKNTKKTQVILFESKRTGEGNRLLFQEDAATLSQSLGIQGGAGPTSRSLLPSGTSVIIDPLGQREVPFLSSFSPGERGHLFVELQMTKRPIPSSPPPADPFFLPPPPGFHIQGITVESEGSVLRFPTRESAPSSLSPSLLSLLGADVEHAVGTIPDKEGNQSLTLPLSTGGPFERLRIANGSNDKTLALLSLSYEGPLGQQERASNTALSQASDAIVHLNGIEVRRPSNTIEDLVPGLTLNLLREGDREISLKIDPDNKAVKDRILQFVYHYNQIITEINILSSDNPSVIDELDYLSREEREDIQERLGLMYGDLSLMQIKNHLQQISSDAYPTSAEEQVALLSSVGISTNASGASSSFSLSKLRGYLEIDEEKLDATLASQGQLVKDLFGSDSDGDLLIDTGIGHAIDIYVGPYLATQGILSQRISQVDRQIDESQKEIEDYGKHLADYEKDLRRKYTTIEGLLRQLETTTQSLESLQRREK